MQSAGKNATLPLYHQTKEDPHEKDNPYRGSSFDITFILQFRNVFRLPCLFQFSQNN
jgi:hypothetical protein